MEPEEGAEQRQMGESLGKNGGETVCPEEIKVVSEREESCCLAFHSASPEQTIILRADF